MQRNNCLITCELLPITELQERFVQVANGEIDAFSVEEKAWKHYLGRKEYERKNRDKLGLNYVCPDNPFYNRRKLLRCNYFSPTCYQQ